VTGIARPPFYDYLTRDDHDAMGGMFGLATYGGRINTVAPRDPRNRFRHALSIRVD